MEPGVKLRREVVRSLVRIAGGHARSQGEVSRLAGLGGLDGRDRAFATELLYGCLRHGPGLIEGLRGRLGRGLGRTHVTVIWTLVLAEYQIRMLDRVPVHAAVSTAVDVARQLRGASAARFVNAVLRNGLRQAGPEGLPPFAPEACYPAFILESFRDLGPDRAERAPRAYLAPAPHVVRPAGASPAGVEQLLDRLREAGVEGARAGRVPGAVVLPPGGVAVRRSRGKRRAFLWIPQDEASLAVAWSAVHLARGLGVAPAVLDACAGRGVKSELLRRGLGPGARVVATDRSASKLRDLHALDPEIRAFAADLRSPLPVAGPAFDLVVVDAPCSGLGTLRRRPEIRIVRKKSDLRALVELQQAILSQVARAVRPGGTLLYAVCSFHHEEGPGALERFRRSEAGRSFEPLDLPAPPVQEWSRPDGSWLTHDDPDRCATPADTFFAAALRRIG